jgi:hemoglobin
VSPGDEGGDPACWAHLVDAVEGPPDLDSVGEVHQFVTRFYRQIAQDERFHRYFNVIARVDWHAHTLQLTDFWAGVLFETEHDDADAVIESHRWLHEQEPFDAELFERWLEIFDETLDGGWQGPLAERARHRARGMAWAMARRIAGVNLPR